MDKSTNKERWEKQQMLGNEGAYFPTKGDGKTPSKYWQTAEDTLKFLVGKNIVNPEEQKKILTAIQNRITPKKELETVSSGELIKRYEATAGKPVEQEGLYTGLATLDKYLLGIQPKNFVTICARTGVGKTLIANYMVAKFAEQGEKILYLALEENEQEVGDRWAKIVKNNGFNVPDNAVQFSYSEMISAIKEDKYNLIPIITLYAQLGYTMLCVDMLNNLIDTVRDEDGNVFLNRLITAAQEANMTLLMTARLRQPQTDKEKAFPTMESVYGRVDLGYIVSKCIGVTALDDMGDGHTYLRLHILKNRRKQIGMKLTYPRIQVDNLLKIVDTGDDEYAEEQYQKFEGQTTFGGRTGSNPYPKGDTKDLEGAGF